MKGFNMEKKRKLIINAAEVDISEVTPEVLDKYDSVTVNSGVVFSSPAAREAMAGHSVNINSGLILDKDPNILVSVVNGKYEIKPGDILERPTLLLINGRLNIAPDSQEALRNYVSIVVNGKATYPESMARYLGGMKVNGKTDVYPDGAIILDSTFVMDKTFALRAKKSAYYAGSCVVMVSGGIDIAKLREKGVSFITKTAIISEAYVEEALPLFDDNVKLTIVPDGCAYIRDDTELNDLILRKYGTRLYIDGNLTVMEDGAAALKKLEYLRVEGTVRLMEELKEDFLLLDAEYTRLILTKGFIIYDKVSLTVDLNLLNKHSSGIMISDCVNVRLSEDITPERILSLLKITDCVNIFCSSEQRSAVESVSEDVVSIFDGSSKQADNDPPADDEPLPVVINAASYKL